MNITDNINTLSIIIGLIVLIISYDRIKTYMCDSDCTDDEIIGLFMVCILIIFLWPVFLVFLMFKKLIKLEDKL